MKELNLITEALKLMLILTSFSKAEKKHINKC